ncbi:MAG: phosphoglucomutase/phosphomannomutase family protein [Candidatus Bathyarchaeota archaeon]|nr:phosphoglucomutase/phosphomannomutase family protein [Candidatus Bathyarchaeota archaeon]
MTSIRFGTDGWRGLMGKDFTTPKVKVVAQAIATYVKAHGLDERGIVVGYDTRKRSKHFAEKVCEVMIKNQIRVYLTERDIPTPVSAYAVLERHTGGAVMITASHNPPEYNGLKYIPEYAGPALPDVTDEISKNIEGLLGANFIEKSNSDIIQSQGSLLERISPVESYFKFVESQINVERIREANLKIVCDPMHGTGRGYIDHILRRMGCDVTVIHGERDPSFGGHRPEPVPELLTDLKAEVTRLGADLGVATDGDSDRSAVYDQNGTFFSANQLLPLLFSYLVKTGRRGGLVRTVATTHFADRIAESFGLPVYEVPVGFKFVGQYLREKDVLMGAEESGGMSFEGHVPEKDGIFTCVKVVEMRAVAGKSLHQLFSELQSKYGTCVNRRVSVPCAENLKEPLMERLASEVPDQVGGFKVMSLSRIDGVKIILEGARWLLIRSSGTEPIIRVYAEASDEKNLDAILEEGRNLLSKATRKYKKEY